MRFIYINKGLSPTRFAEYLKKYDNRLQQQGQKYNQLLMEGLVANGAEVLSVSARPINRAITGQKFFKSEKEREKGIDYYYVAFFNMKILRALSVSLGVFFKVLFAGGNKKDTVVVCDGLNISASAAAIAAAWLRGFHTVGIVTDVPGYLSYKKEITRVQRINLSIMQKFKSYLLLTEPMSDVVNPKKRPYIVLEGHSDIAMKQVANELEGKDKKKICLYAGSLMKVYGIGSLVDGFVAANVPDSELHIYGSGDYEEELKQLIKEHPQVHYCGVAPNSVIVEEELKATLLVNPRPSGEEYTKYSFPSKNMEYMASGTPVLTTKLPGMPSDHLEHVYLIEEENAAGIERVLRELLTAPREVLHEKGKKAKAFVLQEKNNVKQAEKFIKMLENVL